MVSIFMKNKVLFLVGSFYRVLSNYDYFIFQDKNSAFYINEK